MPIFCLKHIIAIGFLFSITACESSNSTYSGLETEPQEETQQESEMTPEQEEEEEEVPQEPQTPLDLENPFNYLALGDSYTIGQGVSEAERWPNQLSALLAENNVIVDQTDIIAQTGWTTTNLLNAIAENTIEGYQLVSLLIGVNNQFQGRSFTLFESEFELLLLQAIEFAGDKNGVFVVSIPDYGVTPFGSSNQEQIASDIDRYNAFIAEKCAEYEIPFIDVTTISRQLGASSGALATDNLHPSGPQYSQWADEILPVVLELLGK